MKRWRLLEKKRKHWYSVSYRMEKSKDGVSLQFFTGNVSISDHKRWGDINHKEIGDNIVNAFFSDKHKYDDYVISISMVSKL